MAELKLGDFNKLKVVKEAKRPNPHAFGNEETFGIFLDGGREGDILMPKKYVPEGTKVGDEIVCFLYLDQDERLIATTETPIAKAGEFGYLECSWVNEYGAFLNWGVMKDIFCPFREQKKKMEIGNKYIVHLHMDENSYRMVASAKVEHYFSQEQPRYRHGQPVEIMVWQKTDLGFKVIIDNKFPGLVYEGQIFKYITTGDKMTAYIDNVRPDGKIDVTLQPTGRKLTADFADTLLAYLHDNNGMCHLGDKSDAEDIKRTFQVSKKTFKKAVGDLYKRRLITISPEGLKLV